jgi:hypothetical protein
LSTFFCLIYSIREGLRTVEIDGHPLMAIFLDADFSNGRSRNPVTTSSKMCQFVDTLFFLSAYEFPCEK